MEFATPMGTQKSHLEPQGDHLSLQECVLKGAFQDLPFLLRLYTLNRIKTSGFWTAQCGRNVVNRPNHISRNLSRNLVLSSFGLFLDFFMAPSFDGLWMAVPIKGGRAAPERLQEGIHFSCLFFEPHNRGGPPLLRGTATT